VRKVKVGASWSEVREGVKREEGGERERGCEGRRRRRRG
jgi:hypothetical protein